MLKKYGTKTPLTDENYKIYTKIKRLETIRKIYGVDNPMQDVTLRTKQMNARKISQGEKSQSFRTISPENRIKARKKIANKYNIVMTDERTLNEYCGSTGISKEWAYKVIRNYGENELLDRVTDYRNSLLSLDSTFISMIQELPNVSVFSNKPVDGISYTPDFTIGQNLYVKLDRLYWSSDVIVKDKLHSFNIRKEIEHKNHSILQFRAHEISRKRQVILSIISGKLGISKRISSKKCEVSVVPPKTSDKFFEENHMLSGHTACKSYGLYLNNELVMCAAIRVRDKTAYIERVSSRNGEIVTGGLGRIVTWIKNNILCKTIVAYCDLRYDNPSDLESVGFDLIKTAVDWQWTNGVDTFHKSKCRSKMDDRLLPESSYAAEMGFHKIYDAGKAKYLMINKKG